MQICSFRKKRSFIIGIASILAVSVFLACNRTARSEPPSIIVTHASIKLSEGYFNVIEDTRHNVLCYAYRTDMNSGGVALQCLTATQFAKEVTK